MSEANAKSEAKAMSMQGRFCWYDWMGDDVKAAADFYGHVVGWKAKESDMAGGRPYTIISAGDYGVGGLMKIPEDAKAMGARPSWSMDIHVAITSSTATIPVNLLQTLRSSSMTPM